MVFPIKDIGTGVLNTCVFSAGARLEALRDRTNNRLSREHGPAHVPLRTRKKARVFVSE